MAVEEFIESVGRRSEKTADAYQRGLDLFALCHHVDSPDLLVTRIKAGKLNQYQLLDKFISFMNREGYAINEQDKRGDVKAYDFYLFTKG